MINNTFQNLNEIMNKWQHIKEYCHDKTIGNGFYDFTLTATNWQAAYAWQDVVSSFIEPSSTWVELNKKLDYYCDVIYDVSAKHYERNLEIKRMVDVLFYESLVFGNKETEFLNIVYGAWFKDTAFEIYGDVNTSNKVLEVIAPPKRQQRWNPMNSNIIKTVRENYEAHIGQGEPVYVLCVDAIDAKKYTTRYIITFRDAFKTGITKLTGKIELSAKASEVLYGNR